MGILKYNLANGTALAVLLALLGVPSFVSAQQVTGVISQDAPTTVVVQGEKKGHRPSQWLRAESAHFIVYSDASHADVTTLLTSLEKFRFVLRSYLHQDTADDAVEPKTEIDYLAHEKDLDIVRPGGPDYAIGLYKSCEDGELGFGVHMYYAESRKLPLEKRADNEGLGYIFDAYARHYFYQNGIARQPTWFVDGFAHYFSTTRFDSNEAIVGMAPQAMARYLNMIGNGVKYTLDYKDVLEQKEENGHSDAGISAVRNEYQVRAWILVHYILSSPANWQKFQSYMKALAAGQAPLPAWRAAFDMTPGQLNEALWRYRQGNLQAMKLDFKALPEAEISFEKMPASSENILLWQSALRTCPASTYGPTLLKRLHAEAPKFPDSDLAQLALSRAEIVWGDPNAALPYLTRTPVGTSTDAEALYLLGRAHLALAQKADGTARTDHLTLAMQALGRASVLDPKSPATAWYFYRAQVLKGAPDDDSEGAVLQAWQEAPEIDTYALHAGLMYAYLGRNDDALQALHTVADNPRGRSLAAVAATWIEKIQAGAGKADLLAAMRADYPAPEGGLDDWTLATADVVQAVQNAADSADAEAPMGEADPNNDGNSDDPTYGN